MKTRLFVTAAVLGLAMSTARSHADDGPLERFQQVDQRLYRGAQPDVDGFRYLKELGVRTVVNLRESSDARKTGEQRTVESLGMRYVNLPVKDGSFFTQSRRIPDATVRAFFALVDRADAAPVFVHCRRGADRTGAIVGMYRIARQGWSADRAYAEARELGMRGWYKGLKRQLLAFMAPGEGSR